MFFKTYWGPDLYFSWFHLVSSPRLTVAPKSLHPWGAQGGMLKTSSQKLCQPHSLPFLYSHGFSFNRQFTYFSQQKLPLSGFEHSTLHSSLAAVSHSMRKILNLESTLHFTKCFCLHCCILSSEEHSKVIVIKSIQCWRKQHQEKEGVCPRPAVRNDSSGTRIRFFWPLAPPFSLLESVVLKHFFPSTLFHFYIWHITLIIFRCTA